MADDFRDLLAKLDEFEPSPAGPAGTREFATTLVEATIAFSQRLEALEQKLDKNNELLHNMIKVLSSRG